LEQGRDDLVALLVLLLDRFRLFGSTPLTGNFALGFDPRVPPSDVGCVEEDFLRLDFRDHAIEALLIICVQVQLVLPTHCFVYSLYRFHGHKRFWLNTNVKG